MTTFIGRRQFIAGLSGAAALPLAARTRQSRRRFRTIKVCPKDLPAAPWQAGSVTRAVPSC